MPVPDPRDPEATCQTLTRWLVERMPGARVTALETPEFTGFSSEMLMATISTGERLAIRVAPRHYQVFPDVRFDEQYRVMRVLADRTDIPVPPVRWYEPDPAVLGAPFMVMPRIEGRVPTDMPPYHTGGWVMDEADPAERSGMWWSALGILARLHQLDPAGLDLEFLDQPEYGAKGIEQRLGYYEHYMNWAWPGPKPTATRALAWLKKHRPEEPHPPRLLWGDSRIGNVIYAPGGTPLAALDWETATFGQPEEDLAWYLYLDRHHSEGCYAERLDGFPGPAPTIERYEELLGRPMLNMPYYEVLSAFKFTVIMSRIGNAMIEWDWMDAGSDFPYNNNASRLADKILEDL
jgi:aminoglycoside phosphotransferase (APT) family kinase protein